MPKLPAVAIALLAAMPLGGLPFMEPVRADDPGFTLPPFRVGDVASYEHSVDGPLDLSIGPLASVMDKSMRMVEAFPVLYAQWGSTEYVSPDTMTLETVFSDCTTERDPEGACIRPSQSWTWYHQGAPGVMGATYLQGRAFQTGDSWDLPGGCAECTSRRVTIGPPDARSPPGADFVAHVQGDYVATAFKGRIHMSASSPFPLLVEWSVWGVSARLLHVTPGTAPLLAPTPPAAPSYAPLLPVLPFVEGRPVEGTPLAGWPSWSDARNLSGLIVPEQAPGARFVSVRYPPPLSTYVDAPARDFAVARIHQIEARYAAAAADDVTTHQAITARVDATQAPLLYEGSSRSAAAATPLPACPQRSIPLWDAVRAVLALPYLHDFQGVEAKAPTAANCRGELVITGQFYFPPEGGFGVSERVSILATEGHLRYAITIVQP